MTKVRISNTPVSLASAMTTWIPLVIFVVSVAFWSSTLDAFNYPKQAVLLAGSGALLVLHLLSLRTRRITRADIYFFILFSVIVLITSLNDDWKFRLWWGMFGRANGALTYLGFIAMAALVVSYFSKKLLDRIFLIALVSFIVQCAYGLLQFFDLDPVPWNNPHSPVITFFGNPNFSAASFGFLTIAALKYLRIETKSAMLLLSKNALLLSLLSIGVFLNYQTRSIQGLVTIVAGVYMFVVIKLLLSSRSKKLKNLSVTFLSIAPLPVIIGSLGVGPLSILRQETLLNRLEYWRVAIRIIRDHFLLGVGADGYGLYYGAYRTLEYTQKYGPSLNSSAAHNVLLQWGVSFGIWGFLAYSSVLVLTVVASIYIVRNLKEQDRTVFIITFVTWATYQLTAMISIEQIGTAIWGWAFSGLLIGWAEKLRRESAEGRVSQKVQKETSSSGLDGLVVLLLVLMLFPATTVVRQDIELRQAIQSPGVSAGLEGSRLDERGRRIFEAAKGFAGDRDITRLAMISLFEQGPVASGIELSKLGYELERRNTQALEGLAIAAVNENRWKDVVDARERLLKLDPYDYLNEAKLGNAYYKLGNVNKAIFHFERANSYGLQDQEMTEYIQLEKLIKAEQNAG